MPAPRPLVTAMVASAGALVLSCLSAFALTGADAESSPRAASTDRALPPIALSAPASLEAAIGTEPTPIAEPPAGDDTLPPPSRRERVTPPSVGRVPQPAPAPAPVPAPPVSPAPTPEPTPSPTTEPTPSPEPTTTPTPDPPVEAPEQPTSGERAPDESSEALQND
ncbi:outer membrane biosynthesis protein TonB [Microbacterium sp. SORGH_AS428]|uniref:hypothetical protein n=1 Tax=Microbacterium sp. SORGH_AS_0428 TaxID=3041788 RepID=UPI002855277F|nr:hypothetical protein [Microbacterium sp. SORGH_AS_0428]MDR6198291.1 outer membrane biosynthesis protein TonB [Microbacterium sp. SORGH_AS_0428]